MAADGYVNWRLRQEIDIFSMDSSKVFNVSGRRVGVEEPIWICHGGEEDLWMSQPKPTLTDNIPAQTALPGTPGLRAKKCKDLYLIILIWMAFHHTSRPRPLPDLIPGGARAPIFHIRVQMRRSRFRDLDRRRFIR